MKFLLQSVSAFLLLGLAAHGQVVPAAMQGKWIVIRDLTEKSQGCYDPIRKKALVGLKLTLTGNHLVWNGIDSKELQPRELDLSIYDFQGRYTLWPHDLGITAVPVHIVYVVPSVGIPVNAFVLRGPETLLIDACNVWLEADRDPAGAVPR